MPSNAERSSDDQPASSGVGRPVGGSSRGNRLTLFTDGDAAFRDAYEAIQAARERVWLEMYIMEPDEVGRPAIEALAEAARRGCDVILLFDRFGSPALSRKHIAPIQEAGGRVVLFNPALPWRKLGRKVGSFLHRDHRKILIADDVGVCGGRNISTEYGGAGPEAFFDESVRIEGPAVQDLARVFIDSFFDATGEHLPLPPRPAPLAGGLPVAVLGLNARQEELDLNRALHCLIDEARDCCYLMTPYFIPPRWFMQALVQAVQRGVDVRILTAGRSDVPLARIAARHVYGDLLEAGARIFEMQQPILHAKHLTVDAVHGVVSSYNVDRFGEKHNLEVGVIISDAGFARQLDTVFMEKLAEAEEVTLKAWMQRPRWERLVEWMLFQLAKV